MPAPGVENSGHLSFPLWLQAGFWGTVAGAALLVGAGAAFAVDVPDEWNAVVMAFGAGVLFSALSFDLVDSAFHRAGIVATAIGFLGGGLVYSLANEFLSRRGARDRKRSGHQQPSEKEQSGSGLAIAVGALMDGIPESIAIGLGFLGGGSVGLVTVIAIFISNIPEGLSSVSGMKKAGRSARYIFGVWGGIAIVSGAASVLGATLFGLFPDGVIAATTASAAGAMVAMLCDTMVPEAFQETHNLAGLVTVLGFLVALVMSKLGG